MYKSIYELSKRKQKVRCYSYCVVTCVLIFTGIYNVLHDNEHHKRHVGAYYNSRKLLQQQEANNNNTQLKTKTTQKPLTTQQQNNNNSNKLKSTTHPQKQEEQNQTCEPPSVTEFPVDLFTQKQRKNGGIVVHLLISIYMLLGLALICDYYFVASLEVICHKLKLQPDVAGASFMAVGSSAPELFASLIGVFITKGDIGIGTILGSAVFNVLFVLGVSACISSYTLVLAWWPVTRDTLCYSVTLICLAIVIYDGLVTWIEALIMIILYAGYLVLMWYNNHIEKWFYLYTGDIKTHNERFVENLLEQDDEIQLMKKHENEAFQYSDDEETNSSIEAYPDEPPKDLFTIPSGFLNKIEWFICLPINAIFFVTIPDIRRPSCHGYYHVTFLMSIIWIGFLTYVLVWMVAVVGATLNIPDTVMGLTFIAFGSSVPDALASMCVAKQGKGDMAVSQALGSNVFDILFGLGLPWLIKTLIFDLDSTIEVQSVGMLISCFIILILVLATLGALHHEQFILSKKVGIGLLIAYALFLLVSVLMEVFVWSAYHLPTCSMT